MREPAEAQDGEEVFRNVRGIVCAEQSRAQSPPKYGRHVGVGMAPRGPSPCRTSLGWQRVKREGDLATWLILVPIHHGHFTCLPWPQFPLRERQV